MLQIADHFSYNYKGMRYITSLAHNYNFKESIKNYSELLNFTNGKQ